MIPNQSLNPDLITNITHLKKNKKKSRNKIGESDFNLKEIKSPSSFWIEGYGCSSSFNDMEMICGQLLKQGYLLADTPDNADFNLIVTCSVKDVTEHKMIHRIKNLTETNKPLIIAGCLPSANQQMVEKLSPKASLMGPNSIEKTTEVVESTLSGNRIKLLQRSNFEKINLPKYQMNPIISIIQISTGCLSECTFCQTKVAKGNLKSFRVGEIVKQIKLDILNGSKEIWLSSTDNGCYGLDIGTNLINLLKTCDEIEFDYRLRVGMMNPMYLNKDIINDLIGFFVRSSKVYKFLHIPVQSGSEEILRAMKRGHTAKTFKNIVTKFRETIPEMTIATDIITGFPGETDKDFEATLDLLIETEPDVVNSSKYSPRPFTEASKFSKIENGKINERSEKLHKLIKEISIKRNSQWINWEGDIIINEITNNMIKGRNISYKSITLNHPYKSPFEKNNNDSTTESVTSVRTDAYTNKLSSLRYNPYFNLTILNNHKDILGKKLRVKVTGFTQHTLTAIKL